MHVAAANIGSRTPLSAGVVMLGDGNHESLSLARGQAGGMRGVLFGFRDGGWVCGRDGEALAMEY